MSEISETEIKSMSKEQNYMRGYEDGKSDVLDKIRAEIEQLRKHKDYLDEQGAIIIEILNIIDKYNTESEG